MKKLPVDTAAVRQAMQTLSRYREDKAPLEQRILEDEAWYRLRHWDSLRRGKPRQVEPVSGWLFNVLATKHAEAMDSYPAPSVLPREPGDQAEAEMLSAILPAELEQCGFEQTYSDVWDYKLKTGTGVYGVFWDPEALSGLGDIAIRKIDLLNLFWEPGVTDIQRSRNVFHVELWDNDRLLERYPRLEGKLTASPLTLRTYDGDTHAPEKTAVVDWYYKRRQNGTTVLHYCKFVGDTVLFATENEPAWRDTGWYRHGKYPFLFDPLFRMEGTVCGLGYIDLGKSGQAYIDLGNQAIMENLLANTRPRYFIRADGAVNETEYGDFTRDFVHVDGNLGQDSVLPISGKPLSSIYVDVISRKIDELKEVTGNRDVSTGGTVSGVTAASAIAAMQEAGGKISRDHIRASYRVFRQVCEMMIELIRQFYTLPRVFRVVGEEKFLRYSNRGLQPQPQGTDFGVEFGSRVPCFDIQISAQKQNPYSKLSQNEMAMSFYSAGLFDPGRAREALACLSMMDFDCRELVMEKIRENADGLSQGSPVGTYPMPTEPAVTRRAREAVSG